MHCDIPLYRQVLHASTDVWRLHSSFENSGKYDLGPWTFCDEIVPGSGPESGLRLLQWPEAGSWCARSSLGAATAG